MQTLCYALRPVRDCLCFGSRRGEDLVVSVDLAVSVLGRQLAVNEIVLQDFVDACARLGDSAVTVSFPTHGNRTRELGRHQVRKPARGDRVVVVAKRQERESCGRVKVAKVSLFGA